MINIDWLFIERLIKLGSTLGIVYFSSHFLSNDNFIISQKVAMYQVILMAISTIPLPFTLMSPVTSHYRLSRYMYVSASMLRLFVSVLIILVGLLYYGFVENNLSYGAIISYGLVAPIIWTVYSLDYIHHIDINNKIKCIPTLIIFSMFFIKAYILYRYKSIILKFGIDVFEVAIISYIIWKSVIFNKVRISFYKYRVCFDFIKKKFILYMYIYIATVLAIFLAKAEQIFSLTYLGDQSFSSISILTSIISLFMIPFNIFAEKYMIQINKMTESFSFDQQFMKRSVCIMILSFVTFVCYLMSYNLIAKTVFGRDLSSYRWFAFAFGLIFIAQVCGAYLSTIVTKLGDSKFVFYRILFSGLLYSLSCILAFKLDNVFIGAIILSFGGVFSHCLIWFFSSKLRYEVYRYFKTGTAGSGCESPGIVR